MISQPALVPPTKRRRIVPPSLAPTAAAPPPPAPVSAVAARKAALAASAPTSSVNTSTESSSAEEVGLKDEDDVDLELGLSSDDEVEDIEAGDDVARGKLEKKKQRLALAAMVKANAKPRGSGRYFAGVPADGARKQSTFGAGLDDVEVVGPNPQVDAEEFQKSARIKMGRGKRQRREKSAFTDPMCTSSFVPKWGENTHKYRWTRTEDGVLAEGVVFCLETVETLVIHGAYTLAPIFGSVSALSATLSALDPPTTVILPPTTSHQVFAPSSHPLPVIGALQLPLHYPSSTLSLPDGGPTVDLSSYAAVVLVSSLTSGIEGVEKVLRSSGMGCGNGMWDVGPTPNNWGGQGWKLILDPTPSLTSIRSLESWTTTLAKVVATKDANENDGAERAVFLVEGPKRVGKSTFAKHLTNKLLSIYEQVAYLDTDLGQPEFTPPGFLSLSVLSKPILGPSFTHPSVTTASHFLGSLSPAADPAAYLASVSALLTTYALEVEYPLIDDVPCRPSRAFRTPQKIRDRVPLVINTQGWVKGLGADLLVKLKDTARPTHVFSFDTEDERDVDVARTHGFLGVDRTEGHFRMAPAPSSPLDSKWSAADLRTLAFISYFHARLPPAIPTSSATNAFPSGWDFSRALVARSPYAVDWSPEARQIATVHVLGEEIAPAHILHALNASLVAIVVSFTPPDPEAALGLLFPYSPAAGSPQPSSSRALGLALVRSILPTSQTLLLLTPVHPSQLAQPVSLVKGAIELPVPLWLDFVADDPEGDKGVAGTEWSKVPYLDVDGGDGGRKRARRNLMRRGQN